MWLRDPIDIEVQRNANVPIGFQLLDYNTGEPIDISGYTILMKVAANAGEAAIATFNAVVSAPLLGSFDINLLGASFPSDGNTKEEVNLAYDLIANDGTNGPVIMARGTLILNPGVN